MHFFDIFNYAEIYNIRYEAKKLCNNNNLLVKCTFNCENIKNKLKHMNDNFEDKIFSKFDLYFKFYSKKDITYVDLRENPEFNTNFKAGRVFWTELKKHLPKIYFSSLNFSVTNHIAAKFYDEKFNPSLMYFYEKYNFLQSNKKYFFQYGNLLFNSFLKFKKFNIFSKKIEVNLKNFNFFIKKNLQMKKYKTEKINLEEIFLILSCMGCDRCHLWSTIQFTGLNCALKLHNNERVSKYEMKCLLHSLRQYLLAYEYFCYLEKNINCLFVLYYNRIYIFSGIFILLVYFSCK